jgi:hypothetical protein
MQCIMRSTAEIQASEPSIPFGAVSDAFKQSNLPVDVPVCLGGKVKENCGWVVGEHGMPQHKERTAEHIHEDLNADGHIGTLCCWALLNLSNFEPAQV